MGSSKRMFFSLDVHQRHIRFWLSRYFVWKVSLINIYIIYTSIPSSQTHLTPFFCKQTKANKHHLMTLCGGAKISSRVRRELGVSWSNAVVVAVAASVAVPSAQKNARPRTSAEVGLLSWGGLAWGVDVGG